MIALIILGSIAAVIAAILSLSITVTVKVSEETTVKIGILCFHKTLIPEPEESKLQKNKAKKEKKKKKEKPQEEKKEKPKVQKPKDKKSFTELLRFAVEILQAILPNVKTLLQHIRITSLRLYMLVGGEAADEIALNFGKMNAAVHNALALTDKALKLKVKSVDILPDFVRGETECHLFFKAKLRLARILKDGICILVKGLGKIVKSMPHSKAAWQKNPPKPENKEDQAVLKTENQKEKATV